MGIDLGLVTILYRLAKAGRSDAAFWFSLAAGFLKDKAKANFRAKLYAILMAVKGNKSYVDEACEWLNSAIAILDGGKK